MEGYPWGGANNVGIMHNTRITYSKNRSLDMGGRHYTFGRTFLAGDRDRMAICN